MKTHGRILAGRRGEWIATGKLLILAGVAGLAAAGGCSDATGPAPVSSEDGVAVFDGRVDPGRSSFVLQRIEAPGAPGMAPIQVELIGSNLRLGELMDTILLDVALRNVSGQKLYAPAWILVHGFQPPEVTITNADEETDGTRVQYAFDYSALLGSEGVLAPGASSKSKTWSFHDPGLQSFSFAAEAHFSLMPDLSHIAGFVFQDYNFNGVHDPDDIPVPGVAVGLRGPGIENRVAYTDDEGHYVFFVDRVGLYTVRFRFESDSRCGSSPNPLEVLLTPGPDGRPISFDDANYWFSRGCGDSLTAGPAR